jgi:Zn finger protein HypA/HybF involved in hydrogenase expression
MSTRSNKETFIEKSINKHFKKYDYSLVDYVNNKTKVKIICKKHGLFEQRPDNHLNGQNCPNCTNNNIKSNKNEFIKKSLNKFGNIYDYSLVDYVNNKTKVKIICKKHGLFEQRPDNHLKHKIPCKKCDSDNRILDSNTIMSYFISTHGYFYDYSKFNYKGRKIKSIIICPYHGEFLQTPHTHILGSGCKKCHQSNGEKLVSNILNDLKIEFKTEFKFNNCIDKSKLKFDFYIPSLNLCIEYNGLQHYKSVDFFGGEKYFKDIVRRDNIKKKYCIENSINLLVIKYGTDSNTINKVISSYLL